MKLGFLKVASTIAVFCLLGAQTPAGGQVQSESVSMPGRITGHVYRADTHEPLGKAIVVLNPEDDSPGAQRRVATTDTSGAFAFTDLAPAQYAVQAERNGFVTQYEAERNHSSSRSVLLHPGEQISNLVFSLTQAGTVVGVVKDEENDPVPALRVLALVPTYLAGGKLQLSALASEITDDRGSFRFYGLKPGVFYIRVGGTLQYPMGELPPVQAVSYGEQYQDAWFPEIAAVDGSTTPLQVNPGSNIDVGAIRVQHESTWILKGKINGREAGDLKPTEVSWVRDQPFEETVSWNTHSATIQPDGTFVIAGLPTGDYTLTAVSTNNGSENRAGYASIQITDRNLTTTIYLGKAASVRGRVVRKDSEAFGYEDLKVTAEPGNQQGFYVSDVSPDGNFNVQNIPPGTYTIELVKWKDGGERPYPKEISCGGKDYSRKSVPLTISSVLSDCEILLSNASGLVSGVVKKGEERRPNLTVVLIPQSRDLRLFRRYTLTANTDHLGRYEIKGIIPGDYFLFAVQPDAEQPWFALNFADNHRSAATAVSIRSLQAQHSDLTTF